MRSIGRPHRCGIVLRIVVRLRLFVQYCGLFITALTGMFNRCQQRTTGQVGQASCDDFTLNPRDQDRRLPGVRSRNLFQLRRRSLRRQ